MFVIGGLSGVMLGAVPIDIHVSDTYFIVAHIHYVLFGGSVFTIFAGMYYWFPKMTGRMYDERLGKLHFWLTFVGFNLTFFPMHLIGMEGMPRRVADYAPKFAGLNMFISLASFALGASVLVFLYNMITSWRRGPIAPSNPWRAMTLEWQVSSPPPIFNFTEIPQVVGSPYEYGVPGAQHAILAPSRRARPRRLPSRERAENPRQILVVANETVVSQALVELIEETAQGGRRRRDGARAGEPAAPGLRRLLRHAARRGAAAARQDARPAARAPASMRTGVVVETDPVSALRDAIDQLEPDEVIVSTHPQQKSGWLRRNAVEQMRRVAGDLPFQHRRRRPWRRARRRRTCSSSRTRRCSARRSSTRSASARAQSPRGFLIISPQGDSEGSYEEAEKRLLRAVTLLRSEGIEAHGQISHPDPFAAVMQTIEDERVDELIVSTFPDARSGWLRRNLLERLRDETKLPIKHVEVDVPAGGDRLMAAHAEHARPRRARAPARAALQLADLAEHPRHVPLHRVGDHAVRRVLHGLLLRARRRGHGRGRRRRSICRSSSRSSTRASS